MSDSDNSELNGNISATGVGRPPQNSVDNSLYHTYVNSAVKFTKFDILTI